MGTDFWQAKYHAHHRSAPDRHAVDHLAACLRRAADFLNTALETLDHQAFSHNVQPNHLQLRERLSLFQVLLSCQVLWQTIYDFFGLGKHWNYGKLAPFYLVPLDLRLANLFVTHSRGRNLSPAEFERMPNNVLSRIHLAHWPDGLLELAPRVPETAQTMGPSQCLHVRADCFCSSLETPLEDSTGSPALPGTVTLVRLRLSTSEGYYLERRNVALNANGTSSTFFIAICHVGAGLENDVNNSLRHCQILKLSRYLDTLSQSSIHQEQAPFWWINSLCVPTDPAPNDPGTHQWKVWAAAAAVLVIDPCLERQSIASSLDAIVQLRYSRWKQSTKSLGKCLVAKRLLFQFGDRAYSLDSIVEVYRREWHSIDQAGKPTGQRLSKIHVLTQPDLNAQLDQQRAYIDARLPGLAKVFFDDIYLWFKTDIGTMISTGALAVPPQLVVVKLDANLFIHWFRAAMLACSKYRLLLDEDVDARDCRLICRAWNAIHETYGRVENLPNHIWSSYSRLRQIEIIMLHLPAGVIG